MPLPDDMPPSSNRPAPAAESQAVGTARPRRLDRRVLGTAFVLVVVVLAVFGAVVYLLGPLVHNRDQRSLVDFERTAIANASRDDEGLGGHTLLPTRPPAPGSAVGIIAIPAIGLQEAVVEGAGPSQTMAGPGHVPGTAGLGQPGNAAVVGRRSGYGGPFGNLSSLKRRDRIVAATTEGQSDYVVTSVRTVSLTTPGTAAVTATSPGAVTVSTAVAPTSSDTSASTAGTSRPDASESFEKLFGPSAHNQLTLVTSASGVPWNSSSAVVVVARMVGKPFTPTPQESLSPSQYGNGDDPAALAWLLLALLGLVAAFAGAAVLYRRSSVRTAYLLTTVPMLVLTVLAAESASRLLPAWL
jgi:sortase A